MLKRILLSDANDSQLQTIAIELSTSFDIVQSYNLEDTKQILLQQFKLIKVVLVSKRLFTQNSYEFMEMIRSNLVFRHIPVICIGTKEDSSSFVIINREILAHYAINFYIPPIDMMVLYQFILNVIYIEDNAYYSNQSIQNDVMSNYDKNLSTGTFWNDNSIDSLIMHSYSGAVCILESIGQQLSIVKTNESFFNEVFGEIGEKIDNLEKFFSNNTDREGSERLQEAISKASETKEKMQKIEIILKPNQYFEKEIYLEMNIKLIEKVRERALFYCVLDNKTEKHEAMERESSITKQLMVILQNYNGGITVTYDEYDSTKFVYANDTFYELFGYRKEEFEDELEGNIFNLILPEYQSAVGSTILSSATQLKPVQVEYEARKRDGQTIWIRSRNTVHYASDAGQMTFITFYEDITSTKNAEKRIQYLNEKLANSEIFFQVDLVKQKVEEYHSKYEYRNYAVQEKEYDYQNLVLAHIYEKDIAHAWRTLSLENLMDNFQAGNIRLSVEYRRVVKTGEVRWFSATAVLVEGAELGSANAFIYAHDIDDKMKNRIAKDKIMDTAVSDITIVNIASGLSKTIKLYDSVSIKSNIVKNHQETLLQYVELEVAKEDREACLEFFQLKNMVTSVENKGTDTFSFWTISKDGNNIRKNATISYLDSTHEDLLLVGRDITLLFEQEKEQQMALRQAVELADYANQAKTNFLSRMSHDMRTPLNGILGITQVAEQECDVTVLKNYLKNVEISSKYLLSLINDTLDLSKIESGKMEFHREPFPLEEFVIGINTVIKPLMDAKKITFVVALEDQISNIAVDKMRFNQIFYNLLSNAAKYTPEGGRVEFRSESLPPKGGRFGMRFHICDNGVGMSEQFLKVIFEPFTQEFGKAHKEQRGTGLGMAIVKQMIDLAEGDIQVKSKLGSGTEFIVDLYAYTVDEVDTSASKNTYNEQLLQDMHILLVDDTEITARIVKKMLEYKGCIVDIAENGQRGIELFMASEVGYYDVILTDVRMPVMDGFEEARIIRGLQREDAKTIPIIAATADAYEDIYEKILMAGMNERLIKPIESEILCATIVRVIEERLHQGGHNNE